ncbi:MAG TPA: class I SAM-dependent methyltransferase [Patescibacteria group bacterium]|nr:class I SAM-dependent methyltransferase [Patescibacteria group bacterium]
MAFELFKDSLFVLAAFLLLWNVNILVFNRGIPNIRTAPAIRKKIIALLQEHEAGRPDRSQPYIVYDLGSGNGLFARQIARSMPQAKVVGVEISAPSIAWSVWVQRLLKIPNLEYRHADVFATQLHDAGAVVLFFYQLDKLGAKLHAELKPGTLITSNKFRLGDGWQPLQSLKVKTLYPFQKRLFVYMKTALQYVVFAGAIG